MKAVYIARHGGPECLEVREAADPKPGPGEVVIRTRAAGINFADIAMRQGLYVGAPPPPFVPGYEAAGVVESLGPGVTNIKEGEHAIAMMKFGGYAEKIVCPAAQAMPIPKGRSFEEGAALPVNYETAYHALYVLGNLRPGSWVLIHTAAGGVGLAAIQLAKLRQARIIGTASASKHPFLKEQGVEGVIDYRTEDFAKRVKEITGGKGVQLALDPIGGSSFLKSYRCLAPAGTLVCYGLANSTSRGGANYLKAAWSYVTTGLYSPLALMLANKGIAGFHLGLLEDRDLMLKEMAELHRLWADGKIRPHVGQSFSAEKAGDAHAYIQDRKNVGKVVLTF